MIRPLLLLAAFSTISFAATFTVTTTAESGPGSLHQAMQDALFTASDDVIEFDQSPGSPFLTQQTLTSTQTWAIAHGKVTIIGPSLPSRRVTLSGEDTRRVLLVNSGGHLVAMNLRIISGSATGISSLGGGCLVSGGNRAEFINCLFQANYSDSNGGAIAVDSDGEISLQNCSLHNNDANVFGGGLYLSGGRLTATNSTISNNSSEASGGGLYITSSAIAEIDHCTITQNRCSDIAGSASHNGGGISCNEIPIGPNTGTPSLSIRNSLIAQNTDLSVDLYPDVYQSQSGLITSRGNNFVGASGANAANGFPTSQPTDQIGTNASPFDPQITFVSTVSHITYEPSNAISPIINAGSRDNFPAAKYGNPATDQLGRPRISFGASDIGAVEFNTSTVVTSLDDTMDSGTLRQAISHANSNPGTIITFDENTFGVLPQEINLTMGELLISQPTIIYAPTIGVTLQSNGNERVMRITSLSSRPVSLENMTLRGGNANTSSFAAGAGGGIYVHGTNTRLDLYNINPRFNSATTGAGIAVNGAQVNITSGFISGNIANTDGGGIHLSASAQFTADQITIALNSSGNRGGGIYSESSTLTLTRSTLNENSTDGFGGGMNLNTGTTNTITNCTVSKNKSDNSGGGIFTVNIASADLTSCTISGNRSDHDLNNIGFGGGIRAAGSGIPAFNHCLIAQNTDHSSTDHPDASGTFTSNGYNLIGNNAGTTMTSATGDQIGTSIKPIDPKLKPLGNWGGFTNTFALSSDSPAIDAGDPGTGLNFLATDQRGLPRRSTVTGTDAPDIGAYEYQHESYTFWANYTIPALAQETKDPLADNDGDGIINALEHIFGTDPRAYNSNPMITTYDATAGNYSFTFPLSRKVNPDTIRSESSLDLIDWAFFTIGITNLTGPKDENTQEVRITIPNGGEPSMFFRLGLIHQ